MPDKPPALREPWLRGTLTEVPGVQRAVLHALELAEEDLQRWCGQLTDEQLHRRPSQIAPVAFHLRHIARSLDRLLTYAEGASLNETQMAALKSELSRGSHSQRTLRRTIRGAGNERNSHPAFFASRSGGPAGRRPPSTA